MEGADAIEEVLSLNLRPALEWVAPETVHGGTVICEEVTE